MIIKGNTVGTTTPRSNWNQNNPNKADYVIGKEVVDAAIANAQNVADNAQAAAANAQTAADNAQTAAQTAADNALPKAGGDMTGGIAMGGNKVTGLGAPADSADAATKQYVDDQKAVSTTATLSASGWSGNTQTVSVASVTASNNILVTAAPASFVAWSEAVVYCSSQGDGTLTFTCEEVPAVNLTANILILK